MASVTLSPWPTTPAALAAAIAYLRANCAGRTSNDDATAGQLGEAAAALIEREAPGAPQAVKNEAAVRVIGYLSEAAFGGVIRETSVGNKAAEYTPFNQQAAIFRNSGAKGLLSPWKVRNAGAIGG